MARCFKQPIIEDDSIVLFSTPDSTTEESACSSSSTASSCRHSPPLPPPVSTTGGGFPVADGGFPATGGGYCKLSVTNLSYTLHQRDIGPLQFLWPKKPKLEILKSVSFTAQSSEMVAIVGPSGTGKSTLLRIISGRVKHRDFSPNTVSVNDQPITSPAQLKALCGYVAQEDDLLPLLTVKETLMFSAKFRLRQMSPKAREAKVESLLQELGLVQVANSFVGDEEHRGISGGERKRVSIGSELIHDPPILLLDEPTSGLDSSSALQVIELHSSLIQKSRHRIVVFSIHQPSYRMINLISRFLILAHGSVAHNGTLGFLEERISHMGYQIPSQLNPLEFAMEIIHKLEEQPTLLQHQFETYKTCNNKIPQNLTRLKSNNHQHQHQHQHQHDLIGYLQNHCFEILTLSSRFWKVIYRTKQLFLARTMQALVGGFGLGSVYVNLKKDQTGVGERLGLFAFSLSFLLSSTVEALPIYLQERKVVMKESSRGSYKISSYMISNTLIFLPFLLIVAILFSAPVYWTVGLNPSPWAFLFFTFTVWLIVLMASSLVLFLSAISPDFIAGNSLICTVLGGFFLFSGYFIPKQMIPKYWMFMYYVSLYRYPLDSLLVNEYWSVKNECFAWEDSKCWMNGGDVLRIRGLEKDIRWINAGIMVGFFLLYRVICWLVLARRAAKTTL